MAGAVEASSRMSDDQSPPADQEHPESIIDEIASELDALHTDLTQSAAVVGRAKDQIQGTRPVWAGMAAAATQDDEVAEIYGSGVHALAGYRDVLRDIRQNIGAIAPAVAPISASSDSVLGITAVTHSFMSRAVLTPLPLPPPASPVVVFEKSIAFLEGLDPALAKTYRGVPEVLYGTQSDPVRAALYESRQMFDHFFALLAPDNAVRSSQSWKPKLEGDTNRVTRDERLRYAANTHVKRPSEVRSLIASSRHMLNVYDALQRAHTRGPLDEDASRAALREMHLLVDQWIAAMDDQSFR